jgi:hypothetical protein
MLRLEVGQPAKGVQRHVLDEIEGVDVLAGRDRQSAVRPPAQAGQTSPHQGIDRRAFTLSGLKDQLDGRIFHGTAVKHTARPLRLLNDGLRHDVLL